MSKTSLAVRSWTLMAVLGVSSGASSSLEVLDKSFDAGRVQLGTVIEREFVIQNEGESIVAISKVSPSCGCTIPDYPPQLEPGETAAIMLRIDTSELQPGRLSKSATVETDSADLPRFVLQVKFDLFAPLEILPKSLVYMQAPLGEGNSKILLARPHRDGMSVVSAASSNPLFSVAIRPVDETVRTSDALSRWKPGEGDSVISITLSSEAGPGLHKSEVRVKSSDSTYPEAVIRVNAVVSDEKVAGGS